MPGHNVSAERALELAIEAGAEDVQETEDEEEQPLLQVRHEEQYTHTRVSIGTNNSRSDGNKRCSEI